MLKITLNSGLVGVQETQRKVVRALGLGKFGSCAFHADSPTIRGMLKKVEHLITVSEEKSKSDAAAPKAAEKKSAAKSKKAVAKA
ncbi:MAG: 50S ribosomal protein L30 [Candidatus Obscuribacterales bacterium]|nr:50S ribosomal protein L30 [Candidatus Obscuribacterales bacterium]